MSCEKEIAPIDKENKNDALSETRALLEIQPPQIQDGLAVFQDSLHFFSFYEVLDELYDENQEAFLAYMLENLAFENVYHLLEADTVLTSLEDKYSPIVRDEVMEHVVNSDYEFQVGDALVTYISYEQILVSDINDVSTRTEIQNLTKDGTFIPLEAIPDSAFWGPTHEISSFFKKWCGCDINIDQIDCSTARIWGNCGNLFGGNGRGRIQFRDSPLGYGYSPWPPHDDIHPFHNFTSERVRGNFSYIINFSEDRTIQAHVRSSCSNNWYAVEKDVSKSNICDNRLLGSGHMWIQYTSLGRAFSMRIDHTFNWRGHRIRQRNDHYLQISGNDWRRSRIDFMYSELEVDVKNRFCAHHKWYTADHSCTNCRSLDRRIRFTESSRDTRFCDGDIRGRVGGNDGNTVLWGVTELLEGYECCD